MAKGLTEKQRKILEFIIDFQKDNGFPPTIREIGEAFEIGSLRGVTVHLDALVRKGFMTRGRTSRSIRIMAPDPRDPNGPQVRETAVRLPLVTDLPVDASAPTDAQTERYVSLPGEIANPATAGGFVIRVGATGVSGESILPGDLAVLRPQDTALEDELVAIRGNGGLTIRRAKGTETNIVGRVVGLVRRY